MSAGIGNADHEHSQSPCLGHLQNSFRTAMLGVVAKRSGSTCAGTSADPSRSQTARPRCQRAAAAGSARGVFIPSRARGSARTTWAYSSRSSRRQRSPGPPKVLALAAYPVWPSRSPARAHWRTIRSHTDIWDPDDPVQTIATLSLGYREWRLLRRGSIGDRDYPWGRSRQSHY